MSKRLAFENRSNLKGKIVASNGSGYDIQVRGGAIYKGIPSVYTLQVGQQVTLARSGTGYTIIGVAGSGVAPD